jgi:hypothetical protein
LLSERRLRRALYGVTAGIWLVSLGTAIDAAVGESLMARTAVLFTLAVATSLTTALLLAVFVAPLEKVYRHGYEAGQHACQQHPADLRVVGQRPRVVPIRIVSRDR